ncbi:MAG: class I SAM-dependent methyltransferase [Deltaproteobacteria bacterium]|nr:class I SAM-dependent methyltransferase [Deltaproteobacteria bacterium]
MVKKSGWPVNGTASEAYERYIVPAWMGEWAQLLVDSARIDIGNKVLDVACGTGVVARKAARLIGADGKVAGLDADKAMLIAAKQFAEKEDIYPIEWYHSDAISMPFGKNEYDVVLCQQGLQFFPDRLAALQEMFRVMVPNGRIAISIWRSLDRCPFLAVLADVIGTYLGAHLTTGFHASCSLFDREEIRDMLSSTGFHDNYIRLESRVARYPSLEEFLSGYLSVFPFIVAKIVEMADEERVKMFSEINRSLQVYVDDYGLAAPMESHIIIANK